MTTTEISGSGIAVDRHGWAVAANGLVSDVKFDAHQRRDVWLLGAEVFVAARSRADLDALKLGKDWRIAAPKPGTRVWTDDCSDVLEAMMGRLRG